MTRTAWAASPLLETNGISFYAVTFDEMPELVQQIGVLRAAAYDRSGAWHYGLDDYDRHAVQIFALEPHEGRLVGALRAGLGDVVIDRLGMGGLYLSQFYDFEPSAVDSIRRIVECGRVWAEPNHPRTLSILHGLLYSLGAFVFRAGEKYDGICGTVALIDQPSLSRELVANYLRAHHSWERSLIQPRFPLPPLSDSPPNAGNALPRSRTSLIRALRDISKERPIPPSLHVYLRQGARLLGDVGLDQSGRKMLVPLFFTAARIPERVGFDLLLGD